jgi:cytochrome b
MEQTHANNEAFYSCSVWDRTVRVFHWINALCVIGLIAVGLAILYGKSLGISADGKILLKTIHAYFGYVFVINLAWRLVWGFIGGRYARWKAILPFRKGYGHSLSAYIKGFVRGEAPAYAGHNPLARLMVTLLFVLLIAQGASGLVLAGTDLYLPPFGHEIAEWVTGAGEEHTKLEGLKPGSKEKVVPEAYEEMRAFRKPYITIHKYGFYVLLVFILIHIIGVVVTELRERNGLVSAMFTGNKVFSKPPEDSND